MQIPLVGTLTELLQLRAKNSPKACAYQFFLDSNLNSESITFKDLDEKAREIASVLILQGFKPGDRALLVYCPGIELITVLFGCLYAGIIAVPIYPARSLKLEEKLRLVINDADISVILTRRNLQTFISDVSQKECKYIYTDELENIDLATLPENIHPDSLAYLQYTSGSTSSPKGVKVSHSNLLDNVKLLANIFIDVENSVSWLPPYHDMGLVTGIILPMALGIPGRLMTPAHFLLTPLDWLRIISRFPKVYSVAPNFAYSYCAERLENKDKKNLDLSSWILACNGAEPVRLSTINKFCDEFKSAGFARKAFAPCYGLAEATLMVSINTEFAENQTIEVSTEAFKSQRISFDYENETTKIINVGKMYQPTKIVNPNTLKEVGENQIGEIWVTGKSVCSGYWQKEELTNEIFKARIKEDSTNTNYLRTGDLGFINCKNLYVIGRIKDLIVIRGKNYYPQDIELVVEESHPLIRPNCIAVFPYERDGIEDFVIVSETEKILGEAEYNEIITAISNSIFEEFQLHPGIIAFISPKSLLKTTSGKVQRLANKHALFSGGLKVNYIYKKEFVNESEKQKELYEHELNELLAFILEWINQHITKTYAVISSTKSFAEYGFDSIIFTHFISDLAEHTELSIDPLIIMNYPTPLDLAKFIVNNKEYLPRAIKITPEKTEEKILSLAQERILFLQNLNPKSVILNTGCVFKLKGIIDKEKIWRTCIEIINRHRVLKSNFVLQDGSIRARIIEVDKNIFKEINVFNTPLPVLKNLFIKDTLEPYDIFNDCLIRLRLYNVSPEESYLLVAGHHLIIDAWSLRLFIQEFVTRYGDEDASFAPITIEYYDFANWQQQNMKEHLNEEILHFWLKYLKNAPFRLALPLDFQSERKEVEAQKSYNFYLKDSIAANVADFCQNESITPFILFFTAFQLLLTHHCNQKDFVIGIPVNGRTQPETKDLIGLFVHPLPIRLRVSKNQSIRGLLRHNRRMLNQCYRYQDINFSNLLRHLDIDNTKMNPLFNVTFIMQNISVAEVDTDGITASLYWSESGLFPYDLTLEVIPKIKDDTEIFEIIFKYDSHLFYPETIVNLEGHYENLLEGLIQEPERSSLSVPFIDHEEQNTLLFEWNQTQCDYANDYMVDLILEQKAITHAEKIFVKYNNIALTYQEVNEKANQLAHYLLDKCITTEKIIGVKLESRLEVIISFFAVLKTGCAFVFIDPVNAESANAIKIDCVLDLLEEDKIINYPTFNPQINKNPDSVALLLKNNEKTAFVQLTHKNLCSRLFWLYENEPDFDDLLNPFSFDSGYAFFALLLPLVKGAMIHLCSNDLSLNILQDANISVLYLNKSLLQSTFLQQMRNFSKIQYVIVHIDDYESLDMSINVLLAKNIKIRILYGTPECSMLASYYDVQDNMSRKCCVGKPITNTEVYILDKDKNPVPIGISGDLYIAGFGISKGYVGNNILEKENFILNPYANFMEQKLYKTNRLARFDIHGNLNLLKPPSK